MICRDVLGYVHDEEAELDWVKVSWEQSLRRALRLVSRGGERVDVLLPPGQRLKQGDVLAYSPDTIAVQMETIAVIAIQTPNALMAARLAFHLGNLHLPAQVTADAIFTPDDGPARSAAEQFGLTWTPATARFYPEPVTLNPLTKL